MGLFKRLFGREKETEEAVNLTVDLSSMSEEQMEKTVYERLSGSEKEREIVNCCERIMEHTNELKTQKEEYEMLTNYLKDTELIENLPEDQKGELESTAQNIVALTKSRDQYLLQNQKISEERIEEFSAIEDKLPGQINELKSNEAYQTLVKRDMDRLEGEKSSLKMEIHDITREQKHLNKILRLMFGFFIIWIVICGFVALQFQMDMSLIEVIVCTLVALVIVLIYIRIQDNSKALKQAEVNINHAITLLNQMKAKYVGITNAVDYVCEKYDVQNSYELNYLWDQYMETMRDRENLQRTNDDLAYYSRVLRRQLENYNLYDYTSWTQQAPALVDHKEMVEVKHRLLERRQKCRTRMDDKVDQIRRERNRIQLLIRGEEKLDPELQDILKVVDQICDVY